MTLLTCTNFPKQRRDDATRNAQLLVRGHAVLLEVPRSIDLIGCTEQSYLWYDDIGQEFRAYVQIFDVWKSEDTGVVKKIVFDRIVNVWYFGNVEFILLNTVEIFLQFQP